MHSKLVHQETTPRQKVEGIQEATKNFPLDDVFIIIVIFYKTRKLFHLLFHIIKNNNLSHSGGKYAVRKSL